MSTPTGTITIDGDQAEISFERKLPHPIEAAWEAITDPEQLSEWFGKVASEREPNGEIVVEAGPEHVPLHLRRSVGKILVWNPPHVIEYEWRQAIVEHSTVRYERKAEGDATVLRFTHRWLSTRNAKGFIPGMHAFLDRLSAFLSGSELPDWGRCYAEVQPLYPAWRSESGES